MKITVWMTEKSLEDFRAGKPNTEGYYLYRPTTILSDLLQVQMSIDEYYQLKDGPGKTDAEIMKEMHEQQQEQPWECSLPDGAEWDVKYDVSTSKDKENLIELIKALVDEIDR